jgi:glycosyltransferase involved in cell wall biosynthesis
MRITIVLGPFLPVPPLLGGAVEKVHLELARAYQASGHEVTVMSRQYKDFSPDEVVDQVRHIRIASFDRTSSLPLNLALDFIYALRVARNLPQSDVTVTNSFFAPLLLSRRTAGKIYVHVARFPKYQMALYSRADRLQAISNAVAEAIARQAPGLAEKVTVIGYPVPDDFFGADFVRQRSRTILFTGRIAREKGVHLLVKAFALLMKRGNPAGISDWKLRIVGPHGVVEGGDGDGYLAELRRLAQPLGSACEFVGPLFRQADLIGEYRAATIFVYPSLADRGEAFGLAPLEAMASGCAVIVSNLRCFDDFLVADRTGLKFEHKSEEQVGNLAAELARLVADPPLLGRIASEGNLAARKFRTATIAGQMLADFSTLIAS